MQDAPTDTTDESSYGVRRCVGELCINRVTKPTRTHRNDDNNKFKTKTSTAQSVSIIIIIYHYNCLCANWCALFECATCVLYSVRQHRVRGPCSAQLHMYLYLCMRSYPFVCGIVLVCIIIIFICVALFRDD